MQNERAGGAGSPTGDVGRARALPGLGWAGNDRARPAVAVPTAQRGLAVILALILALILGWALGCVGVPQMQEALRGKVLIFTPKEAEVVKEPFARIVGRAGPARRSGLDLVLALELPPEARGASGVDLDGDGTVGETVRSDAGGAASITATDPDDAISQALGTGAIEMLRGLNVKNLRVALVTYSGETSKVVAALDGSSSALQAALRDLSSAVSTEAPAGLSVIAEPIATSVNHLIDMQPPGSATRRSVVLLLLLGEPYRTLPRRVPDRGGLSTSGAMAGADGIEIYPVLIGEGNEPLLRSLGALAGPAGGVVMQIRNAGDLPNVMPLLQLSGVEFVTVQNKTRGDSPARVPVGRDGEFATDIPLVMGDNEIEVVAHRFGGETYAATRTIRFAR